MSSIQIIRPSAVDGCEMRALLAIAAVDSGVVGTYGDEHERDLRITIPATAGFVGIKRDDAGYPAIVSTLDAEEIVSVADAVALLSPHAHDGLSLFDCAGDLLVDIELHGDGSVTLEYEGGFVSTLPPMEDGHPPRVLWHDGLIAAIGNLPAGDEITQAVVDRIDDEIDRVIEIA